MDDPVQSNQLIDDLTAVCNSLGKIDENDGTYMKDRDCNPCLKEIMRHLNHDSNQTHVARTTLGSLNVIKSDLIPLTNQYCDYNDGDPELFGHLLRLFTNLTSPVLLLFENQVVPTEPALFKVYDKLLNNLSRYKEAFANDLDIWNTLNTHLRHNREDEVTFERLIILIRNILHIPVNATEDFGVHSDFDTHDMCIYRMDKSGMLATLIELARDGQKGVEFCFHITEIIYLILRNQNPELIARARRPMQRQKRLDDGDSDKKRLAELSARDRREREANRGKFVQSRFRNTSFVVQNCRSLSNNPLVVNKLLKDREMLTFDSSKTELRKARNKKPLVSETPMMFSDSNTTETKISYPLKLFCHQFMDKVYINYMQQLKHNLIQRKSQDNDESYYLWAIQFFTAFNRCMNLSLDNISESLSASTVHYIFILMSTYQEKLTLEKKRSVCNDLSKRLHLAVRAYREILLVIKSVQDNADYRKSVLMIQENEYSSILTALFGQYAEHKHSTYYLRDLVLTSEIHLDILESSGGASAIRSYSTPDVVCAHIRVLREHKDDATSRAVLRMFQRLMDHDKAVLMQASVFKCLLDVVEQRRSVSNRDGFVALAKNLGEEFGTMANKRRWMFQELLFWKTGADLAEDTPAAEVRAESPKYEDMIEEQQQNQQQDQEELQEELKLLDDVVDDDANDDDDELAIGDTNKPDSDNPLDWIGSL